MFDDLNENELEESGAVSYGGHIIKGNAAQTDSGNKMRGFNRTYGQKVGQPRYSLGLPAQQNIFMKKRYSQRTTGAGYATTKAGMLRR